MVIGQIWINANPTLRDHLRKVNEERSASFYAAWRAVTAPARALVEVLRQARRERQTRDTLSHLDDRRLADIGISRSDIGSIAQAVAVSDPEAGLTIAELQRARSIAPAARDAAVVAPPGTDQRRGRGGFRLAPRSIPAASVEHGRAAG